MNFKMFTNVTDKQRIDHGIKFPCLELLRKSTLGNNIKCYRTIEELVQTICIHRNISFPLQKFT